MLVGMLKVQRRPGDDLGDRALPFGGEEVGARPALRRRGVAAGRRGARLLPAPVRAPRQRDGDERDDRDAERHDQPVRVREGDELVPPALRLRAEELLDRRLLQAGVAPLEEGLVHRLAQRAGVGEHDAVAEGPDLVEEEELRRVQVAEVPRDLRAGVDLPLAQQAVEIRDLRVGVDVAADRDPAGGVHDPLAHRVGLHRHPAALQVGEPFDRRLGQGRGGEHRAQERGEVREPQEREDHVRHRHDPAPRGLRVQVAETDGRHRHDAEPRPVPHAREVAVECEASLDGPQDVREADREPDDAAAQAEERQDQVRHVEAALRRRPAHQPERRCSQQKWSAGPQGTHAGLSRSQLSRREHCRADPCARSGSETTWQKPYIPCRGMEVWPRLRAGTPFPVP
eukprot:gene4481-biopygen7014